MLPQQLQDAPWRELTPIVGSLTFIPLFVFYIWPKLTSSKVLQKHSSKLKNIYVTDAESLLKAGLAKVSPSI